MGPIADARTDQLVYAAVTGIFEYNFNINKRNGCVKRDALRETIKSMNIHPVYPFHKCPLYAQQHRF